MADESGWDPWGSPQPPKAGHTPPPPANAPYGYAAPTNVYPPGYPQPGYLGYPTPPKGHKKWPWVVGGISFVVVLGTVVGGVLLWSTLFAPGSGVEVTSTKPGDCVNWTGGGLLSSTYQRVTVVPCSELHDSQIFLVLRSGTYDDSTPPAEVCVEAFDELAWSNEGLATLQSDYWDPASGPGGDKDLVCDVKASNGDLLDRSWVDVSGTPLKTARSSASPAPSPAPSL